MNWVPHSAEFGPKIREELCRGAWKADVRKLIEVRTLCCFVTNVRTKEISKSVQEYKVCQ